jgi:pimeloyl-ACP methyl ester carboxylesterase
MTLSFNEIGTGKPIMLIHAFPLSNEMWKAQAEILADNGFHVILPNLPGFGKDDSTNFYSLEEMAKSIAELLNSLKVEKIILGGLSLGGYVLFNLFRFAPEIFSALILCDTTFSGDTSDKQNSRYELISKIEQVGSAALVENMLPNLISDDTKQNNSALVEKLEEIFINVSPLSATNALRSMAERRDNSDILGQISVPTLLIFGEFDKVTNLETAQLMNQMISGSELVVIKEAGHYSNLEQPGQFNQALLNFCRHVKY